MEYSGKQMPVFGCRVWSRAPQESGIQTENTEDGRKSQKTHQPLANTGAHFAQSCAPPPSHCSEVGFCSSDRHPLLLLYYFGTTL